MGRGREHAAENGADFQALIFKTIADPHVGRVSLFRVFRGTITANSHVQNSVQGQGERIGQLFYMRGKDHVPADSVGMGDIAAVGKLANSYTNDTLVADGHDTQLEHDRFPGTFIRGGRYSPRSKADLDKLGQALHRMVEEDPTLHLGRDPITGESIPPAWANRMSRCARSHEPPIRSECRCGFAAGRLPGELTGQDQFRVQAQEADRRGRSIRPCVP